MKALRILGLAFALALIGSIAHAQGIQRICTPTTNSQGAPNCQDVATANPFPVQASYLFSNITTQTTTLVKTGAGVVHSVCVNTGASGATITLYNNIVASGAKIATVAGDNLGCVFPDAAFTLGLTVVTATATADVTVSYR